LSAEEDIKRKKAVFVAILGIILVGILLGFNGYRTVELNRDNIISWKTTENWLEGTPYEVTGITITYSPSDIALKGPSNVLVKIAGTGSLPDIQVLAANLEHNLGHDVILEVRSQKEEITALSGEVADFYVI
jgi:hypothetical protein